MGTVCFGHICTLLLLLLLVCDYGSDLCAPIKNGTQRPRRPDEATQQTHSVCGARTPEEWSKRVALCTFCDKASSFPRTLYANHAYRPPSSPRRPPPKHAVSRLRKHVQYRFTRTFNSRGVSKLARARFRRFRRAVNTSCDVPLEITSPHNNKKTETHAERNEALAECAERSGFGSPDWKSELEVRIAIKNTVENESGRGVSFRFHARHTVRICCTS